MKNLRTIRILLATLFLVAALAYLIIGPEVHPMAIASWKSQILPSALGATLGATVFWFAATFLTGRTYCATVCPVGTMQDCAIWLRRRLGRRPPFSYRPARRWRYDLLLAYIVCVLLDIATVCFIIEPWNMTRNMASIFNPEAVSGTWGTLAFGSIAGIVAGILTLPLLMVWAYLRGREFCTDICPLGTAMGAMHERTLLHIEIDPDKCTNCLKCEDVCPARCIKLVSRYVDNSRCLRCMECIWVCPDEAIRLQMNRNRRGTPLLRRRRKA